MEDYKQEIICEYKDSVNEIEPVGHRRYTFLSTNEERKLTVGLRFDSRNTDVYRNEVLGEWAMSDGEYTLYFHINIGSDESYSSIALKNEKVRADLINKIRIIINLDQKLIIENPILKESKVMVYFKSSLPYYNKFEAWGIINDYLDDKDLCFMKTSRKEIELLKSILKPYIDKEILKIYGEKRKFNTTDIDVKNINLEELINLYEVDFILRVREIDCVDLYDITIRVLDSKIEIIKFEKLE